MDPEDPATPERREQLRCSMAMLTPGQLALTREEAMLVLERLVELQRWVTRCSCRHQTPRDDPSE